MRVFITGISRGLGAGIARAALDAGAEVWGCSRKAPETLGEDGSERLHFCPVDLTADSAAQTVRDWLEGIDGFDRVYLNAGMLAAHRGSCGDLAFDPAVDDGGQCLGQ